MQESMIRPSWDDYWLEVAKLVSTRATCPRASVGAVIVRNNRSVTTGYNGAPSGKPHCMDIGCDVKDGHCRRAVHAEFNAVVEAEEQWRPTGNSTIYVYDSQYRGVCCNACEVEVSGAGIIRTLFYPN